MLKLQVSVSDDLGRRIDAVAEKYGCTRSALCSVLLGQSIAAAEKAFSVADDLAEKMLAEDAKKQPSV